ncbi:type II secretion system protein [Hydrogenophaga sp.]|uniref:type II secretion system protein n=1 Tax=Hydrogenophaga sp. TaxID=1904254 RepID=UPI003F71FA39
MSAAPRRRQAGWSLLEAVVVLAILGLMSTGLWKTLALVEDKRRGEQVRDTLQRAEDALHGMALRDHRLPLPDDAMPSSLGPEHWEGWLPVEVLGTEPPRSIRYVVDRSLAAGPVAIYRADPVELLGDGVKARTRINGLDLCLLVVQREQAAFAKGQTHRLALRLQQGQAASDATPTRASGYLELVHRLGCAPAFARLATGVKAAVLASDLAELARLDMLLRELAVREAEDSLRNHQWRVANAMARFGVATWNLVATKLTGATTPLGAFHVAANVAGFAFEAARWTALIDYSLERAQHAQQTLDEAMDRREMAHKRADQRNAAFESRLQRVDALQVKGLMP